jgi:hypothetical protein
VQAVAIELVKRRSTSSNANTSISTHDDAREPGRSSISNSCPSGPNYTASRTPTQETVLSSPKDYDVDQWSVLLKCDDDLAKVAEKIRLLGDNCVDELARPYLLLNDKKYLPDIVRQIIADSREALPPAAAGVTKDEDRKTSAREEEFKSLVSRSHATDEDSERDPCKQAHQQQFYRPINSSADFSGGMLFRRIGPEVSQSTNARTVKL